MLPEGTALEIRILHNPSWVLPQNYPAPTDEVLFTMTLFGPPPPSPRTHVMLRRYVSRDVLRNSDTAIPTVIEMMYQTLKENMP